MSKQKVLKRTEILRFAQNDMTTRPVSTQEVLKRAEILRFAQNDMTTGPVSTQEVLKLLGEST